MQITQALWSEQQGWTTAPLPSTASLAFVFGSREALEDPSLMREVRWRFPAAHLMGCSTAGQIHDTKVIDEALSVTALSLERTVVRGAVTRLPQPDGYDSGRRLGRELADPDLVHVFVLSDGHFVNGSALAAGLRATLPPHVGVTGGLAGDGERFGETVVMWDEVVRRGVAAVGFYGSDLRVGCGTLGGWDPFGPERLVTRSEGNVLYELDGKSALALYKRYLGEQAEGLPGTALLFPLSIRDPERATRVVRTILSVDEAAQSMTFAGDVAEGTYARLMKANFDRLIDGAIGAAAGSATSLRDCPAELGILVSCVGRKMVLGQRIEEEVEGVREVLGDAPVLTGFYSYGEISPLLHGGRCELHNQTMTITLLGELAT